MIILSVLFETASVIAVSMSSGVSVPVVVTEVFGVAGTCGGGMAPALPLLSTSAPSESLFVLFPATAPASDPTVGLTACAPVGPLLPLRREA